MSKAIELMKEAFVQLSSGKAIVPVRIIIDTEDNAAGRYSCLPILQASDCSA